jgi:hypothetical protein
MQYGIHTLYFEWIDPVSGFHFFPLGPVVKKEGGLAAGI